MKELSGQDIDERYRIGALKQKLPPADRLGRNFIFSNEEGISYQFEVRKDVIGGGMKWVLKTKWTV